MRPSTLDRLRCPGRPKKGRGTCGARLSLKAERSAGRGEGADVLSGSLECASCRESFPILGGVAVLVRDVRGYLLEHVKGVCRVVPDAELPQEHARELKAAKARLHAGHIEDDLEAERVTSLYLMNHYLHVAQGGSHGEWWKPRSGAASPLIDRLVREHWENGPLTRIARMAESLPRPLSVIELGCGVGGLAPRLGDASYLGVDSSFASIALARHLVLGAPWPGKIRVPEDLLQGPVSREVALPARGPGAGGQADFVVGELEQAPVEAGAWELSVALNAIDMLEEPDTLPKLQHALVRSGGTVVQSCPYIWHEAVARKLRSRLPRGVADSARAVEWLYERAGFEIVSREEHVPWLFFKHARQLEIYSVHWFAARAQG